MQTPPITPGGDPNLTGERIPDSLAEVRSPRQIRRARRRRALSTFWAQYRKSKMGMAGLIILAFFAAVAIFAVLASKDGLDPTLVEGPRLASPSTTYPLGTDSFGVSVLTQVIQGSKISLLVGLVASVMSIAIGALVGIVAGYRGGTYDTLLMRFTDFGLVVPWLALAIILASIIGPSLITIILVIGLTSWPGTARLVRSQVLSVRERPYVERARALGGGNWHMIAHHVLPNVMPVILANAVLVVAIAILSETALSFLGLGDPFSFSWGGIIESAFNGHATTLGAWWWIGPPGICIVLVVLAFTMIGFALDEIINPKLRER
ncbi:MAG: ABC transporter permease [Actinomycetota bacterium]